jgi:hypothetical protein
MFRAFHVFSVSIFITSRRHERTSVTPVPTLAQPRNLILRGDTLLDTLQLSEQEPYVAVSYTWDQNPSFVQWEGRRVTTQALDIAKRLSTRTPYALWIDAICIPQDDEEAKQAELPKMADIYRGAEAVVCLVPTIGPETCEVVLRGMQIMESDAYRDLDRAGDIYGCYLFATAKGHDALRALFQHRWWERAWTFQETVLNRRTYLAGDTDDTIPADDAARLALVVRRRAASLPNIPKTEVLGRQTWFWDSVSAMVVAAQRTLSLGEAVACVWRRDASVRHDLVYSLVGVCGLAGSVKPSYQKHFHDVLHELFDAAVSSGDYTWMPWCAIIDHSRSGEGMGLIPTPEIVKAAPSTSITLWQSSSVPAGLFQRDGSPIGVLVPYKSTGVIRSQSAPKPIHDIVSHLFDLGHTHAEVWDMLFGIRVGLIEDICKAVENEGIAPAAITGTLTLIKEGRYRTDVSDLSGDYPWTPGYAFMNFCVPAAEPWLGNDVTPQFVVVSSQGGTAVVPHDPNLSVSSSPGRIYVLPVEPPGKDPSRRLGFVTIGNEHYRARAATLVLLRTQTGSGSWQLRRIE